MEKTLAAVDCRWLLWLYAIIPLSLVWILLDVGLAQGRILLDHIPTDPEHWPFWTIVFGLPHIIASLITMADREYLAHYRRTLLWPLIIFAAIASAGYLGPQPLSYQLLFIFFAFYTIYHVLAQQLGLTLMMCGMRPSPTFKLWKWLAIFSAFAIYINVYASQYLQHPLVGDITWRQLFTWTAILLCAGVIALAWPLTRASKNPLGVWYLWGNVLLLGSALLINEMGYTLFVILIPRLIHDLTAYIIYISHDSNRNRQQPVNYIYRATRFSRLPPILLLPLLSILLAWGLTSHQQYPLISIIILTVSFLHYYFEGFIWRGENPHRQQLSFRR